MIAYDWNLKSWSIPLVISLISLWNGAKGRSRSVDFWYFLISLRATVPGLNLCAFLTPPVVGADFLAALDANYFLGAFYPVDFLAVYFVLAILYLSDFYIKL